ncbi:hypothetical protein BDV96DRAFT_606600 [Lophiotrema nucula]|uniref:ferroxidase n=1 Tax=Lophiotrema nucula TaxID=690887 RepID=A0A6A5YM13_9PLEO|nr:hypothetical protein BDV96DRAFT_606600 [Lophiotrema nucula]
MQPFVRLSNAAARRSLGGFARAPRPAMMSLQRASVGRCQKANPNTAIRTFHSSIARLGIMPESENPPPKESETIERPTVPTDISTTEYNERADDFFDKLIAGLEAEQEKRQDLELEYAAGVLEVTIKGKGTFVINKQPPNKQIWLSSPVSGPKRFDWVITGESQGQKEGAGSGDWIYLRDGTSLTQLARRELYVEVGVDDGSPQ